MANETLSWDTTVALYGESMPIEGGYSTRMHADPACSNRLGDTKLVGRKVDSAPAENMCGNCTAELVEEAISSSVILLRDFRRQLERLEDDAEIRSSAVTLMRRIEDVKSIHPHFEGIKAELVEEASILASDLPVYH